MTDGPKELRRRIITSVGWVTVWGVLNRAFPVLAMFVVARQLGAEVYGTIAATWATVVTLETLVASGLQVAAIRHLAATRNSPVEFASSLKLIVGLAVALTSAAALAMLAVPDFFASILSVDASLTTEIRLASLWLFFSAWTTILHGVLLAQERPKVLSVVGAVSGLTAIILIPLFGAWRGALGVIVAWGVVNALGSMMLLVSIIRGLPPSFWQDVSPDRAKHRNSVFPTVISGSLNGFVWSAGQWCALAFVLRADPTGAAVGAFAASQQIVSLGLFAPSMIGVALAPILSERLGSGKASETQHLFWKSFVAIGMVCLLVGVLVAVAAPFISMLYGQSFAPYSSAFALAGLTIVVTGPQGLLTQYLFAVGRSWQLAGTAVAGALVNVFVALWVASDNPEVAAPLALCLAQFVKGAFGVVVARPTSNLATTNRP